MKCAYPFSPGVRTHPRPSGLKALMGTCIHAGIEAELAGKKAVYGSEPWADEAKRNVEQAMIWIRGFGIPTHVESGFAYDAKNDRSTSGPRRGEPGYGDAGEYIIRSTLDLAWVSEKSAFLADVKSGEPRGAHVEQLMTQALALSRATGITDIRIGFLFTRKTKVIPPAWQQLDEDELDAFAGELHGLVRRLPVAQPTTWLGCKWCEVDELDCPALNGSLRVA